jgi:SAM-dependent methyltransferase
MNKIDPTSRFSNRVKFYIKYRPKYPEEILTFLKQKLKLTIHHSIADIGSGTGFLSKLFLQNGNKVYGVEPNTEMRLAAEKLLGHYPNFVSIDGSAEFTDLESRSIDFITAAQAFHWFDLNVSRNEFKRILRPMGWIILIWNERTETSPFLKAYEQLLKTFSVDYQKVDHRKVNDKVLAQFFGPKNYKFKSFKNQQRFNFEGLKGRLLSSSYAPMEDNPNYEPMMNELEKIFQNYQKNRKVIFEYDTKLYYGKIY